MAIYFIQSSVALNVKIGKADDPWSRLYQLQTGHYEDLRLIRLLDGGLAQEKALHKKFSDLHVAREWFRFSELMLGDLGMNDLSVSQPPRAALTEKRKPAEKVTSERGRAVHQIIQLFGGCSALVGSVGATRSNIAMWMTTGIPSKYHRRLVQIAAERGLTQVTFEALEATAPQITTTLPNPEQAAA